MDTLALFADNIVLMTLDAAPWLLFGLLVAGLIHAWVPQDGIARLLGGRGVRHIVMGALLGAPLPICSCGVLPAAIGLRRAGASREATTSFLVSTPETGVDSVALSYAMLGPFLAFARPIAAVFSAIVTGLLMRFLPGEEALELVGKTHTVAAQTSCCSSGSCGGVQAQAAPEKTAQSPVRRTLGGIGYALTDIFDDIALWLVVGLVLAATTTTWIPPSALGAYGSGIGAMVVMVLVGIPMYICATASTPVAASFLLAGVSPGAAMVFMLAGPATNIATLGVVRREMGNRGVVLYLSGIIVTAIVAGLMTDLAAESMGVNMAVQLSGEGEFVPMWAAAGAAGVLLALGLKLFIRKIRAFLGRFGTLKSQNP
ncbi:SO_0444 family Cu/Zn efflux transporter [Magnetovibrio blakemorei]|uniref:Permease n=2 Tax=Pseudomonadota TaxID=1224 RepID=C4RAC7_9PROT|nr:SO_0444 family Cu/Zn efflux transporter [Magnetovibrio blakemorei]OEJ64955.1 hypothetical protein BEN30_00410 [Magnetovibrio blakemorei]CAV30772.1 Permease [Magnetovibrio blakemorei]